MMMPPSSAFVHADRVSVSIEECGAGEDEDPNGNTDHSADCCIRACAVVSFPDLTYRPCG